MKYFKRLNVYKASNVEFHPESCQAYSYGWWRFVDVVNGLVVFNNYGYSNTTRGHQRKVRQLMDRRGVTIDVVVESRSGLQSSNWKKEAIDSIDAKLQAINEKLSNTRRKQALDGERLEAYRMLLKEKSKLLELLG